MGYGKSMMVFHMVREMIGREAFLSAIQEVARQHLFAKTTWSDFFAAFARASGRDFTAFQEQWLTRKGAPVLWLENVEFGDDQVQFKLKQGAPPYALDVPVQVATADGVENRLVPVDKMSNACTLKVAGARSLTIDPDYQLFRRLHPGEIEPTLSQVLGVAVPAFVLDNPAPDMAEAARAFARDFCELQEGFAFRTGGQLIQDPDPDQPFAQVVINPGAELLKKLQPEGLVVAGQDGVPGGQALRPGHPRPGVRRGRPRAARPHRPGHPVRLAPAPGGHVPAG